MIGRRLLLSTLVLTAVLTIVVFYHASGPGPSLFGQADNLRRPVVFDGSSHVGSSPSPSHPLGGILGQVPSDRLFAPLYSFEGQSPE